MLTTPIFCFAATPLTSTRTPPDNSRAARKSFAANAPAVIPVVSPANPVPVATPPAANSDGDGGP